MILTNTGVYNVRKNEKTRSPYPLYQANHKRYVLRIVKAESFTKITVTEICKNAEINRGTFYLHYYDIHDVLSDIFNDMTQDMLTTVDHLFCLNQKSCSYPFCQKIQMESQYRALFLDDAIAPILLEKN